MTEKEKEMVREKLMTQIEESTRMMEEKANQIETIEKQMFNIKNHTWKMVENFKKSHFFLSVAQNMQYDDDLIFNETNVL